MKNILWEIFFFVVVLAAAAAVVVVVVVVAAAAAVVPMRLYHSPDASIFPSFKSWCVLLILCVFSERIKCTSFQPGYVQPSSVMFTYDASAFGSLKKNMNYQDLI